MHKKNKVLVVIVSLYFVVMLAICVIKAPGLYSYSERRELKQLPKITLESVLSGRYMTEIESYVLDQFPGRDILRSIKSYVAIYGLGQKDNHDIYVEDGYASAMEYPFKSKSIEHAVSRFRYVYETFLEPENLNVYYSIIPDKNYFLAEQSGHLYMDYSQLFGLMQESIDFMEYIDITTLLTIEDYYKTDTHWRQEQIGDVAALLGNRMGVTLHADYEKKELDQPFYGVYYGQAALSMAPDKLYYLTNDMLENCKVYDYENNKEIAVYDMIKAKGKDPYEIFLSGPLSLVSVENPQATTEKELIIFRDSFGSSLAPLLAEAYKKITLVDIRYISPANLDKFLEFHNQDVLFIYSTQVLNNSETIK